MNPIEARRLARNGEYCIQEAILGLLDDAPDGLMHGYIVQCLNLPGDGYNATVTGQLHRLKEQDKVRQPDGKKTAWVMTEKTRKERLDGTI